MSSSIWKYKKIVFSFRTFYYFFKILNWRLLQNAELNLLQSAQNNEKIDLDGKFLII